MKQEVWIGFLKAPTVASRSHWMRREAFGALAPERLFARGVVIALLRPVWLLDQCRHGYPPLGRHSDWKRPGHVRPCMLPA
jgi:hypothetical protein